MPLPWRRLLERNNDMSITTYSTNEQFLRELVFVIYQHKGRENAIDRWTLVRRLFGGDAVTDGDETDGNPFDRRARETSVVGMVPDVRLFVEEQTTRLLDDRRAAFETGEAENINTQFRKLARGMSVAAETEA